MSVHKYHYEIELVDETGTRIPAKVECEAMYWTEGERSRRTCSINLSFGDTQLHASDRDFFESLCRLREQLATLGLSPLCYGACRNVFPSGMCRDMGSGLHAYRLQLGSRAKPEIVNIFGSGDELDIVSVETQRQFFDEWRLSVRGAAR
jgi:hypothetical protein